MPTPLLHGREFLVNSATTNDQFEPAITALPDGRFVVVWTDDSATGGDTSGTAIRGRLFTSSGSTASAEFLINTTTTAGQAAPTVTALHDGRFVVAWQDGSATGGDTSGTAIRGQVFAANGTPSGAEFLVNATTRFSQFEPTITAFPDGRFVVAWADYSLTAGDTSSGAIRGQMFGVDGARSGPEFLINTTTAGAQFSPTITALSDGRFVVAWTDASQTGGDTSGDAIRGQIFSAGGAASGGQFLINSYTPGDQSDPSIAALANGGFVVAWSHYEEIGGFLPNNSIRAQVFSANGAPTGTEIHVPTVGGYLAQPSVAALADGRFVVVWLGDSTTTGGSMTSAIRGQVFSANGTPSGQEFQINTTDQNDQLQPTITALRDGRFVVAWTDQSQTGSDTSGDAIRAQIFDPRVGVVESVLGTSAQPRVLGSYDLLDVLPGAVVVGQNASAVRSEDGFATHGTVIVDGTLRTLSSGPVIDAIRLTGTSTGATSGLGGHSVSIGAGGVVRSSHGNGITIAGTGSQVTNLGEIIAGRRGVEMLGGAELLVNQGTISGGDRSFLGSSLANEVRNGGTMIGNASMGDGDDVFDGRGGRLEGHWYGFDGHDRYDGRGATIITGGIYGGIGDDTLLGGDGDELHYGGDGNDRSSGLGGEDALYGGNQNDTLYGGADDDAVYGGSHDDLAYGGAGDDSLWGDGSSDTLYGGAGDDSVDGGTSADVLYGGWGEDVLIGGSSNDTLYGGANDDTLTGGSGADAFVFATAIGVSVDVITDFSVVDDTIRLEDHVFAGLAPGALAAAAFVANTSGLATTAAHRLIYESDTGALFFDADGTGTTARVHFATLSTGLAMTAADFVVI